MRPCPPDVVLVCENARVLEAAVRSGICGQRRAGAAPAGAVLGYDGARTGAYARFEPAELLFDVGRDAATPREGHSTYDSADDEYRRRGGAPVA